MAGLSSNVASTRSVTRRETGNRQQATGDGEREKPLALPVACCLLPVACCLAAALLAACGPSRDPVAPPAPASTAVTTVTSNTLFPDYATTASCEPCHADKVESWLRSPMHNMTREPALADVRGPFDGTTFTFKEDTARLETAQGARFVTLSSKRFGSATYRLTRVIGGHHREDYAGVAVAAARADAPVAADAEELVMPVSWVFPGGGQRARHEGRASLQGLLRHAEGAARAPCGAGLEPDLHLLPQHAQRSSRR